jgi:hypothetical protein
VQSDGILLEKPEAGVCGLLQYPAAAAWDFFVRAYSISQMAPMLKHIGGFPDEQAASAFASAQLQAWENAGYIVRKIAA